MSPSGLDRIARELATGEISRRSALKRLAGAGLGLGAAVAPAGVAEAMGGGCPAGRVKCDGRCCPKNARCRNGRCRCKRGYKKCGRKCVDLQTSVRHCGACGQACELGQSCVNGQCVAPSTCGDGAITGSEVCDGANLDGQTCLSQGFRRDACLRERLRVVRHQRLHQHVYPGLHKQELRRRRLRRELW